MIPTIPPQFEVSQTTLEELAQELGVPIPDSPYPFEVFQALASQYFVRQGIISPEPGNPIWVGIIHTESNLFVLSHDEIDHVQPYGREQSYEFPSSMRMALGDIARYWQAVPACSTYEETMHMIESMRITGKPIFRGRSLIVPEPR